MPKKEPIRTIFMGTPDFAVPSLQKLLADDRFKILAVITQPDAPVGRKKILTSPPVKIVAMQYQIPVLQPQSLQKDNNCMEKIKSLKPDVIIVVAFGQILPQSVLDIPRYGCINVHGSLLPKYRGASPIEETLLHGDKETGITYIRIIKELDAGPMIRKVMIPVSDEDNCLILRKKLSKLGADALPETVIEYIGGQITPEEQDQQKATFCHKISKKDGYIDLKTDSVLQIIAKLKAYTPWPGIAVTVGGKTMKILEAEIFQESQTIKPGEIAAVNNLLLLGTSDGILVLKKVQLEGRRAISAEEFLRGSGDFLLKNFITSAR